MEESGLTAGLAFLAGLMVGFIAGMLTGFLLAKDKIR